MLKVANPQDARHLAKDSAERSSSSKTWKRVRSWFSLCPVMLLLALGFLKVVSLHKEGVLCITDHQFFVE